MSKHPLMEEMQKVLHERGSFEFLEKLLSLHFLAISVFIVADTRDVSAINILNSDRKMFRKICKVKPIE